MRSQPEPSQWMFDTMDARWFRLPIRLRARWWKETDYGRLPPSEALLELIETGMAAVEQ